MTSETDFDLDRDGPWLSAYADGELGPADTARVEGWLAKSDRARQELARLREFGALTATFALRDAPAESWELFWKPASRRTQRTLGWVILAVGVAAVASWGLWRAAAALWRAENLPVVVKIGILAIGVGLVILLISVVRERLYVRAHTRYKDIVR